MKILIAVDFSKDGELAVYEAARRPWPDGSSAKIIHVVHSPFPLVTDVMGVGTAEAHKEYEVNLHSGRELVEGLEAELRKDNGSISDVTSEVLTAPFRSSIEQVIVEEATNFDADLIVVGSRGGSTWKRLFVGSVSAGLVAHAPCSVEVVRAKQAG